MHGVGAWCGCMVWVHGVGAWCGCMVWVHGVGADRDRHQRYMVWVQIGMGNQRCMVWV